MQATATVGTLKGKLDSTEASLAAAQQEAKSHKVNGVL